MGIENTGKPAAIVGSTPAANTEATVTVPSGNTWVIQNAHLSITQGATQTPLPSLQIADNKGNVVGLYPGATAAQTASTTASYDFYEGAAITAGAGAAANKSPLPRGLTVKAGWVVSTSTAGKGANTQLTAIALHVLEL